MALKTRVSQLLPEPGKPRPGNRVELLVNGEQYFPSLLKTIEQARFEIQLETYIFADDCLGRAVREALCAAAERGVAVRMVVDGFGAANSVGSHIPVLIKAGVQVRVFRPKQFFLTPNPKRLRRMHRKVVVIDRDVAFVGGI
ncbi:MAG: phospholipase D-like domain-containing protein, partial [Limnobacter sp.]|nr:phospholipase D-like domain-containing protein [Limnobacter sp.]